MVTGNNRTGLMMPRRSSGAAFFLVHVPFPGKVVARMSDASCPRQLIANLPEQNSRIGYPRYASAALFPADGP
jgi:hypothetical protein